MPGFCREPGTSAIDACIGLKRLLDQNLSFRLLDKLEAAYPGSTQVKFVGLDQADDLTVWQFAKDNGFTIVLIYGSPPKMIWMKRGNEPRRYVLDLRLTFCRQ